MKKLLLTLLLSLSLVQCSWAGVEYDALDDFLSNTAVTGLGAAITISVWIRADSDGEASGGRVVQVFEGGAARHNITMFGEVGGVMNLSCNLSRVGDVTELGVSSNTPITVGQWHHVLVRGQSGAVIEVFVDGVEITYSTQDFINDVIDTGADEWFLGNTSGRARTFDGGENEFAVFTTFVTDAQKDLLASSRLKHIPLQIGSLVFYLPMDDGTAGTSADGELAKDMSTNGNDFTGDDGTNNTGLLWAGESILSYPSNPISGL